MTIELLDESNADSWDAFVRASTQASFFHLSGWRRVLESAFGFQTHFLSHRHNGQVCGILPLALVRRPLFGSALISTPLCVHGGGLGDYRCLTERAIELARISVTSLAQPFRSLAIWREPASQSRYSDR